MLVGRRNACQDGHPRSRALGVPDDAIVSFALEMRSANPASGAVKLALAVLADGACEPGRHALVWSGTVPGGRAASGIYFVRVETPEGRLPRKITLVR